MLFREVVCFPRKRVRALVWCRDTLVDWVAGGNVFHLNGVVRERHVNYAYRFDSACASVSGEFVVIYERLGTKGVLLRNGQIAREINRSFYHANVYEYPVCFAQLESGRDVLIHCPDHYNCLEIDDAVTGARLTMSNERKPADFFHSRLATSPAGKTLISAGWVWHPADCLAMFNIQDAVQDARSLDELGDLAPYSTEISAAAFQDEDNLILATSKETFLDEEDFQDPTLLQPSRLAVWNLRERRIVSQTPVTGPIGTMMPIGKTHVVSFFEHPRIIEIATGNVIASAPHLQTGKQSSSIIHHIDPLPSLALDPQHHRFAVASSEEVRVISVEPA